MSDDIVTFLDSRGRKISNDPRHQLSKLQAQQKAQQESLSDADEDVDQVDTDELDDLKGAELKALAGEEGVDITGLKTVGEVRTAIREARQAAAGDDED